LKPFIEVEDRKVGPGYPTYIIAEMSANHNQDFEQALKIIEQAREVGADAIKLQTYTADTLTIDSDKEYFRVGGGTLWDDRTLYELYGEAYTPWEWQPKLKAAAADLGLALFSSPFDFSAVDFLEDMGVPCYKLASFELVDIPLIEKIACIGKPLIVSTGMASLREIETAVNAARSAGADQIALLKCTSAYPAPPEEMNLRTIPHLAETFGVPTGLSDHTLGTVVPVAAVSVGACIVEKHFTLSREISGPDSAFSLEPDEFKGMVDAIRTAEKALGQVDYTVGEFESKSLVFRRSLFVVEDVKAGETFTERNVRSIRPGHGLAPKHFKDILGLKAVRDIERGTPLDWSLLEGEN
jgi:N-acetylneuraminate synthase